MKVILETIVGSTVHGTAVNDGLEDLDLMAVCVESRSEFIGFNPHDTWTWRTKPEGVRSEAGDTDSVTYGLRKYLSLALKGNPQTIIPLFAPLNMIKQMTSEGRQLRMLVPRLLSKKLYQPYRGFITQQYERLIGKRGQKKGSRPELMEKYGYDTKYAGHIYRLAIQCEELLKHGTLTLPMLPYERNNVIAWRTGQYPIEALDTMYGDAMRRIDYALEASNLPDEPDYAMVENWMVGTYLMMWNIEGLDNGS